MIVSFSVQNFRSFKEEVTFSMVASPRSGQDRSEQHCVSIPGTDEKALRLGLIYGANGAGKSNLIQALSKLQSLVLKGREKDQSMARDPFRLCAKPDDTTEFDLTFIAGETTYRYGLILTDRYVQEEWLAIVEGEREKVLYERLTINGVTTFPTNNLEGEKLRALVTVGGLPNQPFLATILKTLSWDEISNIHILMVLAWFKDDLRIIYPESLYVGFAADMMHDEDFLSFINRFLKEAGTGVSSLGIKQESVSKLDLKERFPQLRDDMLEGIFEGEQRVISIARHEPVAVVIKQDGQAEVCTIYTNHADDHNPSTSYQLDIKDASDGTRRLLHLLPALYQLNKGGGVFVFDEIERSMHPLLARKIIEFFINACGSDRGQLLMTTHESNLLDQDLVRRDEVWLTEKNEQGATQLYSLSEFKPRNDLKLDKHYLTGRFGGIPFLSGIDKLNELLQSSSHAEEAAPCHP